MNTMRTGLRIAAALTIFFGITACDDHSEPANSSSSNTKPATTAAHPPQNDTDGELAESVTRMASIDRAYAATFSPDSTRLAYLSSETGSPQVFITGLNKELPSQTTFFDDQVSGVRWSPTGDTFAISIAPGGGLNSQLYLMPVEGGDPRLITAGGKINNWLGEWSKDGRYLSFSSNISGSGSMDAYVYHVQSGETRLVAENQGIGTVAALSPDASKAVIWRMRSRGDTNLYLVDLNTGEEQHLTPHNGVALSDNAKFADNNTILISTNIDREMVVLGCIEIDPAGRAGKITVLAEREDAELGAFELHPDGTQAALLWNVAGRSELGFLNISTGSISAGPALPAEIAGGMRYSPDGSVLAMTVSGAAMPTNIWTLSLTEGLFSRVTNSAHQGVDLESLARPELIRYQAHDGLELSGWLYRAASTTGPVVLDFHGGPEGQERPSFNATIQALVLRGISVFAANVRGSSGFGKTFVNLDNGALRVNGVKDIKATVDHMIHIDVANPAQIGIMGGSYGGYMVMAGLTEYPELFAAGANLFGVVNFETFFANTEPWMAAISTVEYGDPATQADMLRDLSPIHKVDQVVAPTIVLHGANDTNVPVVEAEQVVANLEQRGVPVKYILFPDEGHGWQKTDNRITSTVEIVKWFETHLATK